ESSREQVLLVMRREEELRDAVHDRTRGDLAAVADEEVAALEEALEAQRALRHDAVARRETLALRPVEVGDERDHAMGRRHQPLDHRIELRRAALQVDEHMLAGAFRPLALRALVEAKSRAPIPGRGPRPVMVQLRKRADEVAVGL